MINWNLKHWLAFHPEIWQELWIPSKVVCHRKRTVCQTRETTIRDLLQSMWLSIPWKFPSVHLPCWFSLCYKQSSHSLSGIKTLFECHRDRGINFGSSFEPSYVNKWVSRRSPLPEKVMVATPMFEGQSLANPNSINGPLSPLSPSLSASGGSTPIAGAGPFATAFANAAASNRSGNTLRMEYYHRKLQQITGQFHIMTDQEWSQWENYSDLNRYSSTPSLNHLCPQQSMMYSANSPIVLDTNGMMSTAQSVPNLSHPTPSIRVSPPQLNLSMNRRFSQPVNRVPRPYDQPSNAAFNLSPTC